MGSVLWYQTARHLRRKVVLSLTASILTGAGAGGAVGMLSAADSIEYFRDNTLETLQASDVEAHLTPTPAEAVATRLAGMDGYELRLLTKAILERSDGRRMPGLLIYQPARRLITNQLAVIAGQGLDSHDRFGVVIDRSLAVYHSIRPGDTIEINPDTMPQMVHVRGIVLSPEFLLPSADPDQVVPSKGSLGIVYLPIEASEQSPLEGLVNHVALRYPDSKQAGAGFETQAKEKWLASLHTLPLAMDGIRTQQERYDLRLLTDDLQAVRRMGLVGGALFLVLTGAFCVSIFRRFLAPWRRQAALLNALGIRRSTRMMVSSGEVASLTVLAVLVSLPVCAQFGHWVASAYRETMGLFYEGVMVGPSWKPSHLWLVAMVASGVMVVSALVALIPIPPPVAPGYWARRLAHLSLSHRLALRGILRRPATAIGQTILLAMAAGLPTGFIAFRESWQTWAANSLSSETWDAVITFRSPIPLSAVPQSPGITASPYLAATAFLMQDKARRAELRLWGVSPPFKHVTPGSLVVPERVARAHGLKIGDTVMLIHGPRQVNLRVGKLIRDVAFETAYIAWQDATSLTGSQHATGAWIQGPSAAMLDLEQNELVASLSTRAAITERVMYYLREVGRLADLAVPIAFILGMLFSLAALRSSLDARAFEEQQMATLGFSDHELAKILAVEISAEGIVAFLSALFFAWGSAVLLDHVIGKVFFSVPIQFSLTQFLFTSGPVFLLAASVVACRLYWQPVRRWFSLATFGFVLLLAFPMQVAHAGKEDHPSARELLISARQASAMNPAGFRLVLRVTTTRPQRVLVRRFELLASADATVVRLRVMDPADLRGTGVLIEREAHGIRRTLYIPELRQSRPLGAGKALDPFLSTDLRLADFDLLDDTAYDFSVQPFPAVATREPWLLVGKPRLATSPYGRIEVRLDRSTRVPLRISAWDHAGQMIQDIETVETRGGESGQPFQIRKARTRNTEILVESIQAKAPQSKELNRTALENPGP